MSWAEIRAEGLRLRMRVTPRGGRNAIEEIERRDDGRDVLKARVAAPADKNRANDALVELLARVLAVPLSSVRLTAGQTSRIETVDINGDAAALMIRLNSAIGLPDDC